MRKNSFQSQSKTVALEDADSFLSRQYQSRVRFCEKVDVQYIPTRVDNCAYSRRLYWTSTEIFVFKREAMEEVNEIMFRQNFNRKKAEIFLYQSNENIFTDENNFSPLNFEICRALDTYDPVEQSRPFKYKKSMNYFKKSKFRKNKVLSSTSNVSDDYMNSYRKGIIRDIPALNIYVNLSAFFCRCYVNFREHF